MIYLGPTGRTKHTEDGWPSSRVRPYGNDDGTVSYEEVDYAVKQAWREREQRRQERIAMVRSLIKWSLIITTIGLFLWVMTASIWTLAHREETQRRIRACAAAMAAQETLRGPVAQCDPLSPSERREAAYQYGEMKGLW